MLTVNGIFEKGQVRLSETPHVNSGTKVLVTFLEESSENKSDFTEDDFWKIISLLDWKQSESKLQILPCINALTRFTVADIFQFEEILAEKLFLLDGKKFAMHLGEFSYSKDKPFSGDLFLYMRCFAIASGKEHFQKVLANPSLLGSQSFESLLYIGERAYRILTGQELSYVSKFSYETYSNFSAWEMEKPVSIY